MGKSLLFGPLSQFNSQYQFNIAIFNTYIYISRIEWINYNNSFLKNNNKSDPDNNSYFMSAYVYFFNRNPSHVVLHVDKYYIKIELGKRTQMLIIDGFNKFLILLHPYIKLHVKKLKLTC